MPFPSPKELKKRFPLDAPAQSFIAESRRRARAIVSGDERRLAILVGPCSIHEIEGALTYAERLQDLAQRVSESCFLVMRVCVEKPRTGKGWKGLLYDPHLDGSHEIEKGISLSRSLLLELAKRGIPALTEFVDPVVTSYFDDLVSWGIIGARTSYAQPHRQLASSLPFPVGFKNGLDGDIEQILHSLHAAALPHTFLHSNDEGRLAIAQSAGNPWAHLILRGALEEPNYETESVKYACERLALHGLRPRVMIDCAHGNCQREYTKQKEVFHNVLSQIKAGESAIIGMMLESYLLAGNQSLSEEKPSLTSGISITDPCLDWSSTEELILSADEAISASRLLGSTSSD